MTGSELSGRQEGGSDIVGDTDVDVLIIGGGPAGSTAATLLAQAGYRVLVAERTQFPRFHIGESLLPEGNRVLERLGVLGRVAEIGVEKLGATFSHCAGEASGAVVFGCGLENLPSAFHVERSRFDQLLLERSREAGAEVREGCQVRAVELGAQGIEAQLRSQGKTHGASEMATVSARYLIDASGQSGFLAKRLGLRREIPALDQVALYAHYEGVEPFGGVPPGDIQVVSRDDMGWFWIIPLSEELTSVGVVLPRARWRELGGGSGDSLALLEGSFSNSAVIASRMRNAVRRGPVRSSADFSYGCDRYADGRWLLAGDAGSFLDPVFSTGVLLALESGAEAADCLQEVLSGRRARKLAFRHYDRLQRRRFDFFKVWVEGFYDPAFRDLFCQPSPRLRLVEAIATILSGNHRPPWSVIWRLRLFRLIWRAQRFVPLANRLHRPDSESSNFEYIVLTEDSRPPLRGVRDSTTD